MCEHDGNHHETLAQVQARLARESGEAYAASPFSALSRDYFSRFSRDPSARAKQEKVEIDGRWAIRHAASANEMTRLMAGHLGEFLSQAMDVEVPVRPADDLGPSQARRIVLQERDGGAPDAAGSHTNCPRCEALGAERVVANLLNLLAEAVQAINPRAQVID